MSESNEDFASTTATTPVVVTSMPSRWRDRRRSSRGTPIDLGGLLELLPQLGEMLQRKDQLVRIVGSKELLAGIRHNTLHYMRGDLGHTTAVVNRQGQIVGHVQLQAENPASVLAPAAAIFQIASAVTLQYYLERFDKQLIEISESVRKAREHSAWAQIARAALETSEIAEVLQRDGRLAPDLRARLDQEERAVDVVALQELLPVEEGLRRLQAVRDEIDLLLIESSKTSPVLKRARAVRDTLPGGLRQRLRQSLDELDAATPHWYLAARAAQVQAALRTLRSVDDQLGGRASSAEGERALLERSAAQESLGCRVGDLLALPAETFDLFEIDGAVRSRIERLQSVAIGLTVESRTAAVRLGVAADRPGEIFVGRRNGAFVVLAGSEADPS